MRERIEHLRGTTARPVELRRKTAPTVSYSRLYEAESAVDNGERKLP